jgi:hypothetical protein
MGRPSLARWSYSGRAVTQSVREVTQSGFLGDYSLIHTGAEGGNCLCA